MVREKKETINKKNNINLNIEINDYYFASGRPVEYGVYTYTPIIDGFRVKLTDAMSEKPVTEAPCVSINGVKVINMEGLFQNYQAVSINLDNFKTSSVVNMSSMFLGCKAKALDLKNLDTSHVTNMG